MADRNSLRLSATLLLIGEVLLGVAQVLHPAGGTIYEAAFADYAGSSDWVALHLGQFVGMMVFISGLLVMYFALGVSQGPLRWVGLFGAIAAGMALALYGVFEAVDGVALKQAVDAWASAPASEKAARFASASAVRWVEWGPGAITPICLASRWCSSRS